MIFRPTQRTKDRITYQFPVIRLIECKLADTFMYAGMMLTLKHIQNDGIVIIARNASIEHTVGLIPKGMVPHIEPLMNDLENYCIQLERIDCKQLTKSMWISVDSLHHITI